MAIVEIHATPSHRYYMRKRKTEIAQRIKDLVDILGHNAPKDVADAVNGFSPERIAQDHLRVALADMAMSCHRVLDGLDEACSDENSPKPSVRLFRRM